ncbi:hypothetical protein MUP65_00170 [Patescibacteria group bacterium]|nr:hypothetical protein [Patescibacteria group bacterium]
MATLITHLHFAQKALDEGLVCLPRQPFLVGTSHPDIRYLAKINRALTHFPCSGLAQVNESDPFDGGVLFHNLLDVTRAFGLKRACLHGSCPQTKEYYLGSKFWEDKHFYSQTNLSEWEAIGSLFDRIYPQEHRLVKREVVLDHHRYMAEYIASPPTQKTIERFLRKIGYPDKSIKLVCRYFHQVGRDKPLQKKIISFYQNFRLS